MLPMRKTLLKTADLVRDKYPRVKMTDTLGDFVGVIADSDAQVYPVLDEHGHLRGIVEMDHIRKQMFQTEKYGSSHVRDIMEAPQAVVFLDEKMDSVMNKFDRTGAWRLPVVDSGMEYVGFLSKSRIMSAYREELKEISQD